MAQIVETVPFNYKEIREYIDKKLADNGYDTSLGSNASHLSNIMAYVTSMLNVNTALNINETLLSYATKRENVVEVARNFSYEPHKATSYTYTLYLKLKHGANYYIPKNTKFEVDGKTYWMMNDDIQVEKVDEKNDEVSVVVKEGKYFTYNDDPESLIFNVELVTKNGVSSPQYYFDIPYTNVEENGLEVYCTYYDKIGVFHNKEKFTQRDSLFIEADDNDVQTEFIRLDNATYGTPRIYFKYAGTGIPLPEGSTVYCCVMITSGPDGAITSPANKIKCGLPGVSVDRYEVGSYGQAEEDIESIRENAVLLYNTSNRLVTTNDFKAYCNHDARVSDSIIWGGNDEFPKSPGHVWFSFLPGQHLRSYSHDNINTEYQMENADFFWDYDIPSKQVQENEERALAYYNDHYLPTASIRSPWSNKDNALLTPGIWDKIEEKCVPTLIFHNRHPIYCEFQYEFDILKYTLYDDQPQLRQDVFNIVNDSFKGRDESVHYEKFNGEYFNASLIKRIDERITDITGLKTKVNTQLVLNRKTLCTENQNPENRDIYIPLGVPYEEYFDHDGYLIPDMLPCIDTPDFNRYYGTDRFPKLECADLFVDWSWLDKEKEEGRTQKNEKLIIAPVKIRKRFKYHFNENYVLSKQVPCPFHIVYDGFDDLEDKNDWTFNNVKVWVGTKGQPLDEARLIPYDYNGSDGWSWVPEVGYRITLGDAIETSADTEVTVEYTQFCGWYYLFNTYKKEILVHLFVDGSVSGAQDEQISNNDNNPDAKYHDCYLYSLDDFYLYSLDNYYFYAEAELKEDMHYSDTVMFTPKGYITATLKKDGTVATPEEYAQPCAYLYTSNMKYLYSMDEYYLTTEGYVQYTEESDNYTGPIVKFINENMYKRSALKADLFYANRYMNLKYQSPNFRFIKNVVPCLRSVKFCSINEELNA